MAEFRDVSRQLDRFLDTLDSNDPRQAELERMLLRMERDTRTRQARMDAVQHSLRDMVASFRLKVRQLSFCREITDFLSRTRSSESLYNELPLILRRAFGAEACSIMILDPERKELDYAGADLADGRQDLRGRPIPLGSGVAGWVAANGRSWLSLDASRDPHFNHDLSEEIRPGSLLCAPLKLDRAVIGVLNLSHSRKACFDAEDERLLALLADQVAVAISHARLSEEARARFEEKAQDLRRVERFVDGILKASDDLILVLGSDRRVLLASDVVEHFLGLDRMRAQGHRLDELLVASEGIHELVANLEELRLVRDLDMRLVHENGSSSYVSINATPIPGENQGFAGFLCIFRSIERRVKNTDRLRVMSRRFEVLFQSATDLASSLESEQVLESVMHHVIRLMDADSAQIHLLSADQKTLRPFGAGPEIPSLTAEECPEGIVARTRKPLLLSSRASIRQFLPNADEDLQSRIMAPLLVGKEILGVLTVNSHNRERVFEDEELNLLTTYVTQASLAIQNSRHFGEARRETQQLGGLLALLRDMNTESAGEDFLPLLLRKAPELCEAQAALLWRVEQGRLLQNPHIEKRGLQLEAPVAELDAEELQDDLLGDVVFREQPRQLRLDDERLPDWLPRPEGPEGITVRLQPLSVDGTVVALLLIYWEKGRAPRQAEEDFFSLLSLQTASAIKRGGLFREIEAAREFLSEVIRGTSDAIIVSDRKGCITLANESATRMLGVDEKQLLGRSALSLYPQTRELVPLLRRSLRGGGDHVTIETELQGSRGRRIPVQLSLGWVLGADRRITGVIGVAKDISEQRKLQEARLESERLKGVERLAVTVSDQINTPLSVILGHLELLEVKTADRSGKGMEKSLEAISSQVERIQGILERLRSIKRTHTTTYGIPNVLMYDLEKSSEVLEGESLEAGRSSRKSVRKGGARGKGKGGA